MTGSATANTTMQAPTADDTCPNFAWWCNAGPTAWTGSRQPDKAPAVTYSSAFLQTLQAIHLLARAEDVAVAYSVGFQAHLAKPIDLEALITTVEKLRKKSGRFERPQLALKES